MKLQSKIKIVLFAIILFCMIWASKVFAVSISVSPSKSTVSPGGSFSVTIKGSDATGRVNISVSGGTASQSSVWIENNSQTITVKAGNSGTVKISASGELSSNSGEDKTVSASASVKIVSNSGGTSGGTSGKKPSSGGSTTTKPVEEKKSTDNTLSALSVKEGNISPEFKKDVKEYTLKIPYELLAVNVTATPSDSKAKVAITGNTDLKEGENTVTVKVTAEDGTAAEYKIKVTRARVPLALQSLIVKYENENGELVEAPLNPVFDINTYDYSLQDLEYWVEKLSVEAVSNLEGATIDIQGADNLQIGENTIVITVKIAAEGSENVAEGEEPKEEIVTYTIKVNKTEEPTIFQKISNWFKGIFGGVSNWYNQNEKNIIVGALSTCIVALFGLSIYIVIDRNKYKDVIDKLKKVNEMNLNSNTIVETNQTNAKEEISKNIEEPKEKKDKKNGKRFK